jgi:hypothetical protein
MFLIKWFVATIKNQTLRVLGKNILNFGNASIINLLGFVMDAVRSVKSRNLILYRI